MSPICPASHHPEGASRPLIPIGILAFSFPILSYFNLYLVACLNLRLQKAPMDGLGWTIYTAVRVLLFVIFVALILRLPKDAPEKAKGAFPGRSRAFDPLMGLRVLAAVFVVVAHYFITFGFPRPTANLARYLFVLSVGCPWAGVWIFFTLSGYLMASGFVTGRYTVTPNGVYRYLRNRWLRILPIYWGLTFLVAVLGSGNLFQPHNWWMLGEMAVFDYRGDLPFNPIGAFWSVSTEVQFYCLVPFLFLGLQYLRKRLRTGFALLPLAILIAGAALRHWVLAVEQHSGSSAPVAFHYYSFGYTPLLTNLDIFLTGMCASFFLPTEGWRWTKRTGGIVLCGIPVALYFFAAKLTGIFMAANIAWKARFFWQNGPMIIVLPTLLYLLVAKAAGPFSFGTGIRQWTLRAIHRLGVLTYAIYAIHVPIYVSIRTSLPPKIAGHTAYAYFPLVLMLILAAATGLYEMVEKPFEKRKHLAGTALMDAP